MTLANKAARQKPPRMPARILVTDDIRLPDPSRAVAALPPGSGLLLRHYDAGDRGDLARRLARIARKRRVIMLVAGSDWRLAARIGAAGIHLPEGVARTLADPGLRLWLRRGHLLSIACHSPRALARAAALGADAALLSPVFATRSHPGARCLGALRFAQWARRAALPVIALGGVNRRTARALRFAAGWAAIDGLMG
jgi:thiamine-phosphate pyrophosphorylase